MGLFTLLKLAFRNIWRNKRRTLITAASIMFAVFFASMMRCLQEGAWGNMVNNIVKFHTGYIQIHKNGFWDEQSINRSLEASKVESLLTDIEDVKYTIPRIENFALASVKDKTKGILVVGTDYQKEDLLTNVSSRVVEGRISDRGLVMAKGLASYLNVGVGDSVVLLSQGYRGSSAVGYFAISGIVSFGSPDLDKQLTYLDLYQAEELFDMKGLRTSMVVEPDDAVELTQLKSKLNMALGSDYEVMDYEEMLPDLLQAKEFDILGGRVILGVLYLIIGFGIFGTVLMMLKERQYEFGILKAIGFKSYLLYFVVWMETVFIGLLGCVMGFALSIPLVAYFAENPITMTGEYAKVYEGFGLEPIIPFKLDYGVILEQAVIVLLMTTLMTIYAFFQIRKLKAVEAMR